MLHALGADLPGSVQVAPTWVPSAGDAAWIDFDNEWDPPEWLDQFEEDEDDPFEAPRPASASP